MYEEEVPFTRIFAYRMIFLLFFSAIIFGVLLYIFGQFSLQQLFNLSLSSAQLLAIIYSGVAIFLVYVIIVNYKLRYVVRRDRLQIMFFPFTITIRYDTVFEIELKPYKKAGLAPGWGVRIWGTSLFITSDTRPYLYIKRMEGLITEFYLSSEDPEQLISRIKFNMKKYFAPRKT